MSYSPEHNKKLNQFDQGIKRIRNSNNNFFENARAFNTIYDLKEIKSYFEVLNSMTGQPVLQFRKDGNLPQKIRDEISILFYTIWPGAVPGETLVAS
jgi:hypothetical protein